MAHGLPDYGIFTAKETTFNLADLADLAVRLGSIVEFDRRGDVVYLDDYESSVARFYDASTVGSTARLGSEFARNGAQSLRFATAGIINDLAATIHYINPLVIGRHGVKVSLAIPGMKANNSVYEIWFDYFDGTNNVIGGVQINVNARTISYLDTLAGWVLFEDALKTHSARGYNFHNLKLVIDMITGKYVRLLYDNFEWDLSTYSLFKQPSPDEPLVSVVCQIRDLAGFAHTIYQDDFVYTINEP